MVLVSNEEPRVVSAGRAACGAAVGPVRPVDRRDIVLAVEVIVEVGRVGVHRRPGGNDRNAVQALRRFRPGTARLSSGRLGYSESAQAAPTTPL